MPKPLHCMTGRKPYPTKRDAQNAADEGAKVQRCDNCRQWHVMERAAGRRRAR